MLKNGIKILFFLSLVIALSGCMGGVVRTMPEMLKNLQSSLQPIWQFLVALSYVLGVCFITIAVMKLKAYGQQTVMMSTHASLGPTLAYFIVGVGLLFLPTLLDIMTVTLWGYGVEEITGWGDEGGINVADIMVPIVQLIQVIGLIAFIRGWLLLLRVGGHSGQPGTLSKAMMHMLGGIMGINISGTISVLQRTLGL